MSDGVVLVCSLYVLLSYDGAEGGPGREHCPSAGQERGHRPALPSHHIRCRHLLHHQVDGGRHRPYQEAEGGGSETGEMSDDSSTIVNVRFGVPETRV